jgi:DNA-binding transcriptional LysR family regulator
MNLRDIDLNLLIFLDALLELHSVTEAARQVGVSQPAMSNALARLRRLLGDPLLVRTSRGMRPTERARALRRPLRSALSQMEEAIISQRSFDPASTQRLFTPLVTDYAASVLMPRLVSVLEREAPHITLNLLNAETNAMEQVERGEADFLINSMDQLPPNFHGQKLWSDRLVCLARRDHPALDEAGRLSLAAYLAQKHILITRTGLGLGWVDEALSQQGLSRNIAVLTRHYQLPRELVAESDLVATLPARIASYQARHLNLAILEPPIELPPLEIGIAWGAVEHYDPAHEWLRQRVIRIANESL